MKAVVMSTLMVIALALSCNAATLAPGSQAVEAMLTLPAPRFASANTGLVLAGDSYHRESANSLVSSDSGHGLFSPSWEGASGLAGAAYAIYRFSLADYEGEESVEFIWADEPANRGNLYFGLYKGSQLGWEFHQAGDMNQHGTGNLQSMSHGGSLYVAVVLLGTDTARLHSVALGQLERQTDLPIDEIVLPDGFSISVYSDDVPNARAMDLGADGTVYVGSRGEGKVYAVRDLDSDGFADDVQVLVDGLDAPVGVDWHSGDLYYSNYSEIWKLVDIDDNVYNSPEPVLVTDSFPTDTHHGWKFIKFGPDGKLYVPQGAPCNICDEGDPYANIMRINADGSGKEIVVRGIRNTVGFDWHPVTGELWFTDNGRDWLGDDAPPDELNRVSGEPFHFGYPYWHGNSFQDPEYGDGHTADEFNLPAMELGPHVAALGMRFYTGSVFPEEYRNQVFIAEHGSWNRTEPLGARITLVRIAEDNETATGYEVFAGGWQRPDGSRWGRPADVLVMQDGSLLVSDDLAGAVYRISYTGNQD